MLLHPRLVDQPGEQEVAAQVDLESLVPGRQLGVDERPEVGVGAGVVDQDVDLREARHGFLHEAAQVVLAAGVGGDRDRPFGEALVDARGLAVEVGLLAAAEDDRGTLLGQAFGDRGTETPAGSGNDGDAPGKVEIRHRW